MSRSCTIGTISSSCTGGALSSSAPTWAPSYALPTTELAEKAQLRNLLICRKAARKSSYSVHSTLERDSSDSLYTGGSKSLESLIREARVEGEQDGGEQIYMDMRGAEGRAALLLK